MKQTILEKYTRELFQETEMAAEKGLILVDTKMSSEKTLMDKSH